jgi:hypothetical protein
MINGDLKLEKNGTFGYRSFRGIANQGEHNSNCKKV